MYSYKLAIVLILASTIGCATAIAHSTKSTETDISSIYLDVQHTTVVTNDDDCAELAEQAMDAGVDVPECGGANE